MEKVSLDMRHQALFALLILCTVWTSTGFADHPPARGNYAVVVSRSTYADEAWKPVADALVSKHQATILVYDKTPEDVEAKLREQFPRFTCFVAKPEEATRDLVAIVHRLTRRLDQDPYTDTTWGVLTGYDAENALRIAKHEEPLTIHRVAAGTDIELPMCSEGIWYCELEKNRMVRKLPGESPQQLVGPDDTTKAIVDTLNEYHTQLMVTSGHATERDWQIGFRYRNGYFRCENGGLYGLDTAGQRFPIDSPNPKVYLPVGNCLMGNIDGRDAMALAWMNSAGVHQMIGYTVPTWFGYGGWGMLDYFVEQPGRFTASEAFIANHQALLHRLETAAAGLASSSDESESPFRPMTVKLSDAAKATGITAQDVQGLLFDRDVVAFYGDPAWEARMATAECAWDQTLVEADGKFELSIVPKRGAESFATINNNGSQRGGRPFVHFLPRRLGKVEVVEGADLNPIITDDFILVPNPGKCDPAREYRVVFHEVSK
jgi:zinc protease